MAVTSSLDDRGHKKGFSVPAPDALLIPIHIFLIPSKARDQGQNGHTGWERCRLL